jgi:hypothetical protein
MNNAVCDVAAHCLRLLVLGCIFLLRDWPQCLGIFTFFLVPAALLLRAWIASACLATRLSFAGWFLSPPCACVVGPSILGLDFCLGASYLKCKSLWVSDRLMLERSLVSTFVSWKGSWAAKLWHRRASGATQFGSRLFCAPQYVCIAHPGSYVSLWMQQSSAM